MNHAKHFLLFISILLSVVLVAQQPEKKILLTGVVLAGDSLEAIPFTNIVISNRNVGTASDENGYFSFYSQANDTILFSSIGYKRGAYIVPEDLSKDHYSIVQIMSNDTVWLQETIIFPWRSYEDFGEELITMKPPINDEMRAEMNLDNAQLYERSINIHMDAQANFKWQNQLMNERMYIGGGIPPQKIFDAFAWASFINSLQNGDYKKKN